MICDFARVRKPRSCSLVRQHWASHLHTLPSSDALSTHHGTWWHDILPEAAPAGMMPAGMPQESASQTSHSFRARGAEVADASLRLLIALPVASKDPKRWSHCPAPGTVSSLNLDSSGSLASCPRRPAIWRMAAVLPLRPTGGKRHSQAPPCELCVPRS